MQNLNLLCYKLAKLFRPGVGLQGFQTIFKIHVLFEDLPCSICRALAGFALHLSLAAGSSDASASEKPAAGQAPQQTPGFMTNLFWEQLGWYRSNTILVRQPPPLDGCSQ